MEKTYKHLTQEEREHIGILNEKGEGIRAIAKVVGRSPSTISREMRRNAHRGVIPFPNDYYAYIAHRKASHRNHYSHARARLKNPLIKQYVLKKIFSKYSPEQIAGRLPMDLPGCTLSHEAIYQYIYMENRSLIPFLAHSRRRRHRRSRYRQSRKMVIPQRVPLSLRPLIINHRHQAGHWEADTIISRASSSTLHVLVERKSRLLKISKLPRKTASLASTAIQKCLRSFPPSLRRSITYDNGTENAHHLLVNRSLGTRSFFCSPYHSWEKGTVENTAGLIRRFFPKRTDFATIPHRTIKRVEALLNNRPRKCLGFKTPLEIFQKSVALAG